MVHYCFNTQAVHCEKMSHLQWRDSNGRVFVSLKVQDPRTDVNTAWFTSCKLSICMAALVELQAACGTGLMHMSMLGSLGTASSLVLGRRLPVPGKATLAGLPY